MKIGLIVEGQTEAVFLPHLRSFLSKHLEGKMPKFQLSTYDGRIPTGEKLRLEVDIFLNNGAASVDHVIALTDVYTGTHDFSDGADAIRKMRAWVGNEPRFHPHVAQYEFEAWLLPYWTTIQKLAGHNRSAPSGQPESVNHSKPPSQHVAEIFKIGSKRCYSKTIVARRILQDNNLSVAIDACPQLKSLVNTILKVSGGPVLR